MAYQLSPRLFLENGPTVNAFEALRHRSSRTAAGLRTQRRIHSLRDGLPVAL